MASQPQHHSINYVELTVADLESAKSFYGDAFGWEFNDYGPEYAGIKGMDGVEVGGLSAIGLTRPGGSPFVVLYSNDLGASMKVIEAAGGQITQGPYEFPGGRRVHFTDPSGNELGVWSER